MHPDCVFIFSEKQNVVAEHECHNFVKLQDSGQASFEETTKRIELLKFPYHDFIVYDTNVVLFLEKVNKKVQVQFRLIALWLAEFLIDLLNYFVRYHIMIKKKWFFLLYNNDCSV